MSGKGKLSSLLMQVQPDMKKIVKYGRSRKLDVDELVTIAVKYASMVLEVGSDLNPLHVACIRNRPDIVSALIQEGYNVNAEIGRIDSYLRIALDYGNIPVAHLLLELGADACSMNTDGKTPMEAALSKNKSKKTCVSAVRLLFEAGVSVNAVAIEETLEKPLHIAVKNSLPSAVSFLLQKGADGNIRNKHGCTPLHYACCNDQVDMIKLLTLHNVELYAENEDKETPMFIAVMKGFNEALSALVINGGCDINKVLVNGTFTALHAAVAECDVKQVKCIISLGADPNKQLNSGATPLHVLAARSKCKNLAKEGVKERNSLEISEFLVKKGANMNAKDTINNCTPLLIAVNQKHFGLAKQFIKLGANLNVHHERGKILFHYIASTNHEIITLALEYGADYHKKNEACLTPYHIAIASKVNKKYIKSFVQFGCPYNQDVSTWNESKSHASEECCKFFKAEEQFFKGIRENNLKLVQKAVEVGAVPTGCSEECKYPLHFVAFNGYKELLKYLLENTFPANTVNDEGETALLVAAKQGHYDICCILLRFGACYNYHSKKCSKTPKMIAVEFKQQSIVDLLQSVSRMFRLASIKSNRIIKELMKLLGSSHGDYLIFVNAMNIKGDTLLSTILRSNYSENAKEFMEIQNIASVKYGG